MKYLVKTLASAWLAALPLLTQTGSRNLVKLKADWECSGSCVGADETSTSLGVLAGWRIAGAGRRYLPTGIVTSTDKKETNSDK